MYPTLLTVLLWGQMAAQRTDPGDPLHHVVRLRAGPEPTAIEHVAELDGTLHVFARSEAVDPHLRVGVVETDDWLEDEASGGGTTAYLSLPVAAGRHLVLEVRTDPPEPGPVELHWIEAGESADTRAAAEALHAGLLEVEGAPEPRPADERSERLESLIREARGTPGADRSERVADALYEAAFVAHRSAAPRATLLAFEGVHEHARRVLPPEHPHRLGAMLNLASARAQVGDLQGALELERSLLATRRRILPPHHPDLLASQSSLAITLAELGDLTGALELEEEVLRECERTLPPGHPELLRAREQVAITRGEMGDAAYSLGILETVLRAREQALAADDPTLLMTRSNLAMARKRLGDLPGALELEEDLLAAWERALPPDHPFLPRARTSLAATRAELGDLDGARELLEAACEAYEATLPVDHPDRLKALGQLAVVREAQGDLRGALTLEEAVCEAFERTLPPDHPDRLRAMGNLAETYRRLGELAHAAELQRSVVDAWEGLLPPDHPNLLAARGALAATLDSLGDADGALELTLSMLDGQLARARTLRVEAPRVARAAALRELARLAWALHLDGELEAEGRERLEPRLFAVLEGLRLVSASATRAAGAAAHDARGRGLRERLTDVASRLNDAYVSRPADPAAIGTWRATIVRLAEERDRLQGELRARLEERGALPDLPDAASVAAGLEPGALLASFYRYQPYGSPQGSVGSVLAFVVLPDGALRRVELGRAAPIEASLHAWRDAIGEPIAGRGVPARAGPDAGARPDPRASGLALRRRVLDPLLACAPEARVLHLVPDDFLYLLPFDALPADEEGDLVGERLEVRLEPTALRVVQRPGPPKGGGLIALGGVDYDAVAEEPSLGCAAPPLSAPGADRAGRLRTSLATLPGTGAEVEAVARLFHEHFESEPVVLVGTAATKARLCAASSDARYLHLATHGWFAPDGVRSMIEGAEDDHLRATLSRADAALRGFAPEVLCGLALAGANRGADERGRVPGILTGEELAALDLSACELAVLSACETNVGIRRAGQGIRSLQSALHAAGARAAITSLWRVDDDATGRLMHLFYADLWTHGLGKARSLWEAKMTLRAEGHPPRDWAGWVLSGDPD